ncbi:MAG: hypothetical protein ICV69_12260 [Thermoleophilaceae bacterium]|nr:hypothetical protein [Thermoleophilaceae bacterium]
MLERFRRRQRSLDGSAERRLELLERRVSHLEELLEGLQDAVHRESVRRDDEVARLQERTAPREMARALSEDARKRGLQ